MKHYYPFITNKKDCRKCFDCANSCPVQAITNEEDWILDEKKCGAQQDKIQDLCINCIEGCRKHLIQLK